MTDWFSKSALAKLLDGFADVPDLYPFPDTTLARMMESVVEAMREEVDDPRLMEIAELLLSRVREKAAAEHFQ